MHAAPSYDYNALELGPNTYTFGYFYHYNF